MPKKKAKSKPETLDAPSTFGGRRPSSGSARVMRLLNKELLSAIENLPEAVVDACRETEQEALTDIYLNRFDQKACLMIWSGHHRLLSSLVDEFVDNYSRSKIKPLDSNEKNYIKGIVEDFELQAQRLRSAFDWLNAPVVAPATLEPESKSDVMAG